jgi:UDP-2-acetamido-3-amino-2,3-dideoxy-glucuronate N-acetyltransferase
MSSDIHPTATLERDVTVGSGTRIWHYCHIREGVSIGEQCIFGYSVYVGVGVKVGNRVKIQNNASLYDGLVVEDGAFIGPHCCFTNDNLPRSINIDGSLKGPGDWKLESSRVETGASIGAGSLILSGLTVGRWSMVGAGSVVTRSIPPFALAYGNPARVKGVVSPSGEILSREYKVGTFVSKDGKEEVTIRPEDLRG